ncbi:MAG: phenylalanine--tRNA ligase subunit alpha, partial [Cellulomonas sp. 14-74-6]
MPDESTVLSPLDADAMQNALDEALAAVAAAADLAALKAVRQAHTGERSPLALANRAIGGLPGAEKAAAGRIVGQVRGRLTAAIAAREAVLEAERDARVLVEEAVDVTLPVDRRAAGARHPLETLMERVGDVFVAMG